MSVTDPLTFKSISDMAAETNRSDFEVPGKKGTGNNKFNLGDIPFYMGVATPDLNPGIPDGSCYWDADTVGVYPHFGGIEVLDGESAKLRYRDSAWTKETYLETLNKKVRSGIDGIINKSYGILLSDPFIIDNNDIDKSLQVVVNGKSIIVDMASDYTVDTGNILSLVRKFNYKLSDYEKSLLDNSGRPLDVQRDILDYVDGDNKDVGSDDHWSINQNVDVFVRVGNVLEQTYALAGSVGKGFGFFGYVFQEGETYYVDFDIIEYTSGIIALRNGAGGFSTYSGLGSYRHTLTCLSTISTIEILEGGLGGKWKIQVNGIYRPSCTLELKPSSIIGGEWIDNTGSIEATIIADYGSTVKSDPQPSGIEKYTNNLLSEGLRGIELTNGTYGQKNSQYKIALEKHSGPLRVAFQVKFTDDLNKGSGYKYPFMTIKTETPINLSIRKQAASCERTAFYSGNNDYESVYPSSPVTYAPSPYYKSAVVLQSADSDKYLQLSDWSKNNMVGSIALFLWLKDPVLGVETRKEWLEANQDIAVTVTDDELKIWHDGVGENGGSHNDGVTSVISSFAMKNESGEYRSLSELYEEVKVACEGGNVLEDFFVDMVGIAPSHTTDDLMRITKIKLVGLYNQRESDDDDYALAYDSYPAPIRHKYDEVWHQVEFLSASGIGYAVFDGYVFKMESPIDVSNGVDLLVGDDGQTTVGCHVRNLEIYYGSLGDAEIVNDHVISSLTPRLIGYMGHAIEHDSDTSTAETAMVEMSSKAKEAGYVAVSLGDIMRWKTGVKLIPKRSYFLSYDDFWFNAIFQDFRLRRLFNQANIPVNFAITKDAAQPYQDATGVLNTRMSNAKLYGQADFAMHSITHQVPYALMESRALYQELADLIAWSDTMGVDSRIVIHHFSAHHPNVYNILEIFGVQLGIENCNDSIVDGEASYKNFSNYAIGRKPGYDAIDFI